MKKNIDLIEGKIFQSLAKLAAPIMGTAFVQIAYILTDIVWVGKIGTLAVAASGTVGILIWFANSLMRLPMVGLSIRSSHAYGARDFDKTVSVFSNGYKLASVLALILSLFSIIFSREIMGFFKLDPVVEKMAVDYFKVVSLGFLFTFLNPVLSASYNSMGNSITPFRINVVGLVINIVMDPVLIFGLGPFPEMGIVGAGLATVFAQFVVFFIFIILIITEKSLIYKAIWSLKFSLEEVFSIVKLGFPAFLQSGVASMVSMVLNKYMAIYGSTPVAVYSIGSMIESVSWMTTDGIASALSAFTGQNYGAKKLERIKEGRRVGNKTVIVMGLIVTLVFFTLGRQIFSIFLPEDGEAIRLGGIYLMIFGFSQVFQNLEIASSGVLNGIGLPNIPGISSMLLNILRIPMALILMQFFGVYGVWGAMSLSSVMKGLALYIILAIKIEKISFI